MMRGGWKGNLSRSSISKWNLSIDLSKLDAPVTAALSISSYTCHYTRRAAYIEQCAEGGLSLAKLVLSGQVSEL